MRKPFALAALATTALLAGCVAPREAAPPPPPPRPAPPRPPVQAPAPPASQDWRDIPVTPGGWSYASEAGGTIARFGPSGAPLFTVRCDLAARSVTIARLGTPAADGATMDVTTSAGRQVVRGTIQPGAAAAVSLPPRDPLLDRMAFSRGRFIVAVPGTARLAVPAWPEFARVVEDCRG